jgi:excisionase family DNA binding protein
MPKLEPTYISIPQLAKRLGISRIAVYKKVKKGIIPAVKIGRNFVVSPTTKMPVIDQSHFTSVAHLAKATQLNRKTIYQKVKQGQINGEKIGRNFVVSREFIQQRKEEEKCISIPQLAKAMGISRVAVFKKVKLGIIKADRVGNKFLISKQYLKKAKTLVQRRKRI